MITKIKGQLLSVAEDTLILDMGSYEYQIAIPDFARRQLQSKLNMLRSACIRFITLRVTQCRESLTPRLIGFLNEAEREFFRIVLFS